MLRWMRRGGGEPRAGAPGESAASLAAGAADLEAGTRADAYVAAAERALEEGDLGTAKRFLGDAIDDAVCIDDLERAEALCRRLLEVDPAVVRVHCTLTFLCIARGDEEGIHRSLEAYVRASVRAGGEGLSCSAIQLMARATAEPHVREWLASALEALGDAPAAASMRRRARAGGALRKLIEDGGADRWKTLLRAATLAGLRR
jgi:hypothetical protein